MRDPINLKQIEYTGQKLSILKLDQLPEFDIPDFDLLDSKDFGKYMDTVKKTARGSFEYRKMIAFLRENMDMNKCSFYENVNNIDTSKIRIEIHHHPFTLDDICMIVFNKRTFFRECLDEEAVAKEVMYLHYNLLIGLIPLSETVHELVHNQYLFIPNQKVMGKYKEFFDMYKDFMTPEMLDVYERTVEFSNIYQEGKFNHILAKNYMYLDLTGAYDFPAYQHIIGMMDNRIKQIKENRGKQLIKVVTFDD